MKQKVLLVFTILLSISLCMTGLAFAKKEFVTLATGSPGGVYYSLGIGMAAIIKETVKGVRCAAESTGASVENTRLISNRIHPVAKQFTPENAVNSPIPLHPASVKYFKDRDVGN